MLLFASIIFWIISIVLGLLILKNHETKYVIGYILISIILYGIIYLISV